jgi:hypothetical protein
MTSPNADLRESRSVTRCPRGRCDLKGEAIFECPPCGMDPDEYFEEYGHDPDDAPEDGPFALPPSRPLPGPEARRAVIEKAGRMVRSGNPFLRQAGGSDA